MARVKIARIQQMQDGMLDAADILIHRQPVVRRVPVHCMFGEIRVGEAGEVPGGTAAGIQRVGVAHRWSLAGRTSRVLPTRVRIQRIALDPAKLMASGNSTGSWSFGTGTAPHFWQWIMGMGQPQGRWRDTSQSRQADGAFADPGLFQPAGHFRLGFLDCRMPSRKRELASRPGRYRPPCPHRNSWDRRLRAPPPVSRESLYLRARIQVALVAARAAKIAPVP